MEDSLDRPRRCSAPGPAKERDVSLAERHCVPAVGEHERPATHERDQSERRPWCSAAGKTGRRVVERLQARGMPVRIDSRSGEPPFDWQDRATWEVALRGTKSAYVSFYPDLAVPGAADAVGTFARLATENGLQRLVLLSGRGEEEAQHAEQLVFAAGTDVTVVRCSWFDQNFSEDHLLEPVLAGEVALPAGDVPEPFVDAEDIADVAVAALTEDGHAAAAGAWND